MRLHDIVEYHGRDRPNAVALRDGARVMTYSELDQLAESFANGLASAGLGPGDRYAVLSTNCLEYFAWYFGAAKIGAVTVPLNPRLAPTEWAYVVNDSGCRLVVARNDLVDAINSVRAELPAVETFVAVGAACAEWETWTTWLASSPVGARPDALVRPEDATIQMYTSGTTGRPKGAILSQGSLLASITQLLVPTTHLATGCMHVVAPLSHVGSTMVAMVYLLAGGSVYVQDIFDPAEVVRVLDEERITCTMLVPAMIQALLTLVPDVAERSFRDLKLVGYGASPITPELLRRAIEVFGCDFFQGFGQTEASGSVTFLTEADHRRAMAGAEHLLKSAGRASIGTEVRVVNEFDEECAPGEIGEIIASGPQLMTGYWNLPEESAKALRGGWLHTGDAGTMDAEGYVYVKDRIKDMIVTGAENVYPAEVEHVLLQHPMVADAAVIGIPDEQWGEAVKACVVLRPRTGGTDVIDVDDIDDIAGDLIAFCRTRIAGFKVPKSIDFMDVLPRNASMKVLKTTLRAPYWEGRTRGVG